MNVFVRIFQTVSSSRTRRKALRHHRQICNTYPPDREDNENFESIEFEKRQNFNNETLKDTDSDSLVVLNNDSDDVLATTSIIDENPDAHLFFVSDQSSENVLVESKKNIKRRSYSIHNTHYTLSLRGVFSIASLVLLIL